MEIIERTILLFAAFTLFTAVEAQTYSPQQIELAERLHTLALNAAPEIAYIQTSKDIYETGEDLWFKVYLLNSQDFVPSLLSKTLYLQLLNENTKKVVWQEKYEIQNGFSNGRVYLDNTLPEGDYLLAAYTPNSFFDSITEFKAVRRIKIKSEITSQESEVLSVQRQTNTLQFTTFPEGGDLVSGIQSKMAFKAVNTMGEPVDIAGVLFEDSVPLVKFKSIHDGMGSLEFTPQLNKRYTIRLTNPAIDSIFPLPVIHPIGITLELVGRDKEFLSFKVTQSQGLNPENIYLRVQCRGIVYGMTMAKLSSDLRIKVPLSELPQGIAEVTLFNSNLVPVAERLVYINRDQKLNITAELSKEIYSIRGKAILKITVNDEHGQPVLANLGISIFDKLYQNPRDSNNILAHYYLSTQLKGRIFNPSFYFNSLSKDRDRALDLLMLTQGWRKYVWSEENLKKITEAPQQVIYDGIRGELYTTKKRKKISDDQAFVMTYSPNKDKVTDLIHADSARVFFVSPHQLKAWEDDYVYLKPFGPADAKLFIKLSDPFETINLGMKSTQPIYPQPSILKSEAEVPYSTIARSSLNVIKEVTIKGQKSNIIRGKYMGVLDSLAKLKLAPKDYVCSMGILNCPNHVGEPTNTKPVEGKTYRVQTDKGFVEVVYHYRVPILTEEEILKMNNLSRIKAYYGSREFYKPNYDLESGNAFIPDIRNTLLWEPSIFTNEKGEATMSFYCSDIYTDFIGRIEGVGGDGLLGTQYFKFSVRKLKLNP